MSHLVPLAGGWSLWTCACLRGAGFAADGVRALADADLARAADAAIELDAEVAARRATLIAACKAAIEARTGEARKPYQRALQRLWQHATVRDPLDDAACDAAREAHAEVVARQAAGEAAHAARHAEAQRAASRALRRIARDDRFRQAMLWQNRSAVAGGVDWLLRQPDDASTNKIRTNERLIASYWQRYCVKNDTIGFFGPVGWARLGDVDGDAGADAAAAIVQRPGPSLLATRDVYFERWAIDALAARLTDDPALRRFAAPRRAPGFRVDGTTLHYPVGKTATLPAALAAVVARCDGERTAHDLARELADAGADADADATLDALDELADAGVIHWGFEIPTGAPGPERALAAQLARIADPALRAAAEAPLAELERARRAVVAAADHAPALGDALAAFDAAFTAATATASRRAPGQSYAGRTPLYEDARRDHALVIGAPVLAKLAAPLALVLDSARWFSHEIAARYRAALTDHYRARCAAPGAALDFDRFWPGVPALFPGAAAPGSIVGAVRDELRRRWAALLAVPDGVRAIQRTAAALRPGVDAAFAAPGPGWPAARHHAPDVMIAAAGPAAAARGELTLVIGELHTGFNTMIQPLFVRQHPAPDVLIAARDADLGRPCIAPVWSKAVTRGDYYSLSPRDLDFETGDTRSARPRARVVTPDALVVEESARGLEVRSRDGAHRFDVIAFFEHHLIAESFAAFSPIAPAPFTPRVAIDEVVIARATWRLTPDGWRWIDAPDAAARFLAARRWARAHGLPRWLFVKTPEEVKPVFVDLDSAVYVELLAKQLRGASAAALSEMLPALDDTWLIDAAGARYTSELRIAAVDPVAWQPPAL